MIGDSLILQEDKSDDDDEEEPEAVWDFQDAWFEFLLARENDPESQVKNSSSFDSQPFAKPFVPQIA
jgi:hypothetical protein